ncbi:MAG: class I SAM-dependent methyltransferase [Chloroflexi bacterium]|nr:class I SAM-dependent methyltransferase [Chloroflexota bacterium]
MDEVAVNRLLAINREFYDRFGSRFAATRRRLQPGVKEILNSIREDESVLDLGCGNGNFLRELARRGHKAPLLGVDFSLPLLREAESSPGVRFLALDLSKLSAAGVPSPIAGKWSLITCFATLHHIPSTEIRLNILKTVRKLLREDGRFILSNWQFLNSAKLRTRIQPWERVGLTAGDVDEGDYLLDWRSGGEGLRYAHQFSAQELSALAKQAGMKVAASFFSDGASGDLGLYQVWVCNETPLDAIRTQFRPSRLA